MDRAVLDAYGWDDILTKDLSPSLLFPSFLYRLDSYFFSGRSACSTSYTTRSINRDDGYHNMGNWIEKVVEDMGL